MKSRANPFEAIYESCNQGNSKDKLHLLPAFPRYLDIELTNRCNFRCLMCPTGIESFVRRKGVMDEAVFHKILEQITPYKTPVRFVRWGEPFLHRNLVEYVMKVKRLGSIVHINTNGSLLTEETIDRMLEAKLDSIKFSFQGVDKISYGQMRNIDFFDELLSRMKLLYTKRGNRNTPFIHASTTITYETVEQVRSFKESVRNYVDLVTVGRTVLEHINIDEVNLSDDEKSMLRYLKSQESVIKKHPECPKVFDKLSINWDGTVSACCADYDNKMLAGNLKINSLKEIWMSPKMHSYRSLLADMRHDELPLCSTCYDCHILRAPG